MTRSRIFDLLALNLAIAASVVFVHDYAKRSEAMTRRQHETIVVTGPRPNGTLFRSRRHHTEGVRRALRDWLTELSPEQAQALRSDGCLLIPYEDLKASDPRHAKLVSAYVADLEARLDTRFAPTGARVRLVPRSVSFQPQPDPDGDPARGRYTCTIKFCRIEYRDRELTEPLYCAPGSQPSR